MDFSDIAPKANFTHPGLNLCPLIDLSTGHVHKGKHGEMLCSGGLRYTSGIGGMSNMGKSTKAHFLLTKALGNYRMANGLAADFEIPSITPTRMADIYRSANFEDGEPVIDSGRLWMTDGSVITGDELWGRTVTGLSNKIKKENLKANTMTLPFIDPKTGAHLTTIVPSISEYDSFSLFTIEKIENVLEENNPGDKETLITAMTASGAKAQIVQRMGSYPARVGGYWIMTAHVDKEIVTDTRAIPIKKLTYLQNGLGLKHVPRNWPFMMNTLWYVCNTKTMAHKDSKEPFYPSAGEREEGDTDLMESKFLTLRSKGGPAGWSYDFLFSQRKGVLMPLTEFHYLKNEAEGFGIGGNRDHWFMDLYDSVKMQRTTVRDKLDEDPMLRRAVELTIELSLLKKFHSHVIDPSLFCDPKTLLEDLTKMGYDRDEILSTTRSFWQPLEYDHEKKYLHAADLLNIRAGTYKPYWMQ